ncbi:MAG: hypothetical protein AB7W28_09880 [Armatimonadota bacterium]
MIANGLVDALAGVIAGANRTAVESRSEWVGGLGAGAAVRVGLPSGYTVDFPVIDGAENWLAASYVRKESTGDVKYGEERGAELDVKLFRAKVTDASSILGASVGSLIPTWGQSSLIGVDFVTGPKRISEVLLRCSLDNQRPGGLWTERSSVDGVELRLNRAALDEVLGMGARELMNAVLAEQGPPLMSPERFTDIYADVLEGVQEWTADHPGVTGASLRRFYERTESSEGEFVVDLGAGLGLRVRMRSAALKGFRYDTASQVIRDGKLVVTARHDEANVPSEDPRSGEELIAKVLTDAVKAAWDSVVRWVKRVWDRIQEGVDEIIAWADGKARAVFEWTADGASVAEAMEYPLELAAYEPSLVDVRTQAITCAYRWSGLSRPPRVRTEQAGVGLLAVASAGQVRKVAINGANGQPLSAWPAGLEVTIRVTVRTADLEARRIDGSLLGRVAICRWDNEDLVWYPLATTRDGDELVAKAPEPGEYMPALTMQALDSHGPAVDAVTRYDPTEGKQVPFQDGAKVRQHFAGAIEITVSDRPVGMNLGVNHGSVVVKVDGEAQAAEVASLEEGKLLVRFTPAASLALGEHSITLEAADTAGYRSTLGPWRVRILAAADVNEDGQVNDKDLKTFRQAWTGANGEEPVVDHRCDIGPTKDEGEGMVIRPDGKIDREDAQAFLELWLVEHL